MIRGIIYFLILSIGTSCNSVKSVVFVPPGESVEVDYSSYAVYEACVNNRSGNEVLVRVRSKDTDQQIRGFGLDGGSRARVRVEAGNKLVLRNETESGSTLNVRIREKVGTAPPGTSNDYISFTLQNKSAKSIPLIIPNVMNPNLSPFSKSGVSLKVGQEILFREKGRKYLLLTVDQSIAPGSTLNVARLLKDRKAALGL